MTTYAKILFWPLIAILLAGIISCHTTPPVQSHPAFTPPTADLNTVTTETGNVTEQIAKGRALGASLPELTPVFDSISRSVVALVTAGKNLAAKFQTQADQYKAVSQQADDANERADLAEKETAKAKDKEAEAVKLYHDSWLGGKTWALFYWIVGLGIAFIVIDTALFLFTGSGTLNPLTLVINLISGIFKKKA